MKKDGNKIFEIHGVYSAPSFDFRPKLVEMVESAVGYSFPDFGEKDEIKVDLNFDSEEFISSHIQENVYQLYVASPAEEPLTLVTELIDTILHTDLNNGSRDRILFTYIKEIKGEQFTPSQIESLEKVGALIEELGGRFVKANSVEMLAGIMNTITNFT